MGDSTPGAHVTADSETIDVVVEIPRGSRNKYEYDHERGVMRLDRRLFSATVYPADYGFIPDTLGLDGDPIDALVLLEDPTFPGCWVRSRPVGMLVMQDEAGEDAKVICVPPDDPRYDNIREVTDLSASLLAEIKHFFDVYKLIEPGKMAHTGEYEGREAAWREISDARARYVPHG